MQDARIKKEYTYFERFYLRAGYTSSYIHTHTHTYIYIYTHMGQRLSDKQELWVGRLVGLGGNMS